MQGGITCQANLCTGSVKALDLEVPGVWIGVDERPLTHAPGNLDLLKAPTGLQSAGQLTGSILGRIRGSEPSRNGG